jgi:hypothetical protein
MNRQTPDLSPDFIDTFDFNKAGTGQKRGSGSFDSVHGEIQRTGEKSGSVQVGACVPVIANSNAVKV